MNFIIYIIAWIAKGIYLCYFKTLRLKLSNPIYDPKQFSVAPCAVYVYWHSKFFPILPLYRNCGLGTLTLTDWKNIFLDALCRHLGYRTVPVTTMGKAVRGLKAILKEGSGVVLAADGPHGPSGEIKPGAYYFSKTMKRPIITVKVEPSRSLRLRKRWDKYEIALPFSFISVTFSDPIYSDNLSLEEVQAQIRKNLGKF